MTFVLIRSISLVINYSYAFLSCEANFLVYVIKRHVHHAIRLSFCSQ